MKIKLFFAFLVITNVTMAQVPNYVPQYGLMSYWPFSGNTNDASSYASHLTNNGAVLTADRFGNPNSAYSFNGIDQSMIRTTPSWTFNSTGAFTVSIWISKPTTASGIALINATTASGNFIWLLQGGASMSYGTNKQQSAWINIGTAITLDVWEHYVCVYDAGTMTYYKNNVVVGTAIFPYTSVTQANMPLYVGQGMSGGYMNAKLDDIGVWNRALTPCEIADLYNSTNSLLGVGAGLDATICQGQSVALSGSGANTYSWNNNVTNDVNFSPSTTKTYTVTGFDANGCSAWDQVVVTVNPISIDAGSNLTVCEGSTVTLSGSGGVSYTWNNGVTDGIPFVVTNGGYYTVTGVAANGCVRSDSLSIQMNPLPPVFAGNDTSICAGESITLVGSGGIFLSWNNGVFNNIAFTPTATSTYILSGQSSTSTCTNKDTILVTVNQPTTSTLTINSLDQYNLNGTVYNSSGTYTQVIPNSSGCDSTITLVLNLDFTGIEENAQQGILFYPNPAVNSIHISVDNRLANSKLFFFSLTGDKVKIIELHEGLNEVDVRNLPSGEYFCLAEKDERFNFNWVKK
ncbi:MAG: LamG-like jellyroll fold domain-containing protein [Crocinitomicaceae bacterium]